MKNKSITAKLCILTLTASMLVSGCAGSDTQTSTGDTGRETETAAQTAAATEAVSETAAEAAVSDTVALEITDTFANQNSIDEALQKEAENGYSFEEPSIIVNPYGTSPLTAVIVFSTEEEMGGTITVKGKSSENDITGTFAAEKNHIVPVYGLYNGKTTQVELSLDDGTTNTVEVTTEKTDISVGTIETQMIDPSAYDSSCLTFACSSGGALCAIDGAGDIRWVFTAGGTLGVHQLANGHLMLPTTFLLKRMYYRSGLQEIDLSGKVYSEYAIPGGMHHDFCELPNGDLLVASDSPDLSTVEDYVVEIDRSTGEVVWELNAADILDKEDGASASNISDGTDEADWFHNNGVWYDEANDLVLLSARHKDAIVAVNKSDKTLAWILGDPTGWETVDEKYFFTPVGDNFEWQYAQHQVTMLDNGDIMLFDNGTAKVKAADNDNRVTGDDVYSRAVIYHINTDDMTIEQVYEYGKERGAEWYSDWISGVVTLDGTKDSLWITAGSHLYNPSEDRHDYGPNDMMTEGLIKSTHIDQVSNGNLVFEMVISGDTYASLTYRSFRMPLYAEGAGLDVTAKGVLLGNLGETAQAEAEISFDDVQTLPDGWNFTLDAAKLSLTGSYSTEAAADALTDGYLVLKNGEEIKVYALSQYGSQGDEGTNVSVTGWVSPVGLEGSTWEIYLSVDGVVYQTGYSMDL